MKQKTFLNFHQWNQSSKSSKNWIFVPKFNFDKTLFFDLFEFLRQSWKMIIYKSIKNLNFRAKNLDFEPKLGLQNTKNKNFDQFWPIFWHFEFKIFQIGCKKIKSRIWTKIGLKKYEKKNHQFPCENSIFSVF